MKDKEYQTMNRTAAWITTEAFSSLTPIDVFHKEQEKKTIPHSAFSNIHTHFVKDFTIDKNGTFRIRISADDYYKLYVNGHFVCQGPAPAYTDCYHYNEFDITPYLADGANRIAVHVYYQGLINRVWNSGDNRMGLCAEVTENEKVLFSTDESWLYETALEYSGETTGYETMFLENIDFEKKNACWKQYGVNEGFSPAVRVASPDWALRDGPTPCVEVYNVKPEKITELDDGYLFDFGCELCGQLAFTAHGKRGDKLTVCYGEELDENGNVKSDLRCNCHYVETLTLSGGDDTVEFFDYAAFRYAAIYGDKSTFDPTEIVARARNHAFSEQCRIESELPYLKEIWTICRNALKVGVQEGYLDCPSREKGQYLGDFTVSGLAHLYLTGDTEQYKKALFDFADTAFISPSLMAVAPGALMQEIADFSLQYPMQLKSYFEYTGDTETLRRLYPTVEGILSYFRAYEREDGLLEKVCEKWNLVDWPANLRDGYVVDTTPGKADIPAHNVLNAFYIGALECENELRTALGMSEKNDTERYKKAFRRAFFDASTGLYCDDEQKNHCALHSNALPLLFSIAKPEENDKIVEFLLQKGLCCGVHFSYFVLKALAKAGRKDAELSLILNGSEHSWVNMLREGASTCFEAWGKDQKWNTSLCHAWASAPIIALAEDILKVAFDDERPSVYTKSFTIDNKQYKAELKLK